MEPDQNPPTNIQNTTANNQPVASVSVQTFTDESQTTTQPVPAASPVTPNITAASATAGQPKHPKLWPIIFIALGTIQVLAVVFWFVVMNWAVGQAEQGVSGTEFVPFMLLPLVYLAAIIGAVNVIGLIIFLIKRRPKAIGLIFSILSLLLSLFLVYVGGRNYYEIKVVLPRENRQFEQQLQDELDQRSDL